MITTLTSPYIIFLILSIPMCWQESKRRKISFIGALALSVLCGTVLPVIGFVGAYIFISGIALKEDGEDTNLLDSKL